MNVALLVPAIGLIPSGGLDQRLRHVEVVASHIYNLRYGNKSLDLFNDCLQTSKVDLLLW